MILSEYLRTKKLTQAQFAERMGVSQGLVWQWLNGRQPITAERAVKIELLTEGEIRRHELRPDLYQASAAA